MLCERTVIVVAFIGKDAFDLIGVSSIIVDVIVVAVIVAAAIVVVIIVIAAVVIVVVIVIMAHPCGTITEIRK